MFCVNFSLFKYCTRILFTLTTEHFGSPLNFAPKMSAPFKIIPFNRTLVLLNQNGRG